MFALLAGSLLAEHPKLRDNCHCDRGNHSVTWRDWFGPPLSKLRLSPLGTTVSEHRALLASSTGEGRGLEARTFFLDLGESDEGSYLEETSLCSTHLVGRGFPRRLLGKTLSPLLG